LKKLLSILDTAVSVFLVIFFSPWDHPTYALLIIMILSAVGLGSYYYFRKFKKESFSVNDYEWPRPGHFQSALDLCPKSPDSD
jgi:hypothetical protein